MISVRVCVGVLAASFLLSACGGGGGDEPTQSDVGASVFLTSEGKLFGVRFVDGVPQAPQELRSDLGPNATKVRARRNITGTFDVANGAVQRAGFGDAVFASSTTVGRVDLHSDFNMVTLATGTDLCGAGGVAVDLQHRENSAIFVLGGGADDQCSTFGDGGYQIARLAPGPLTPIPEVTVPASSLRDVNGHTVSYLDFNKTETQLSLLRLDDADLQPTTVFSTSDQVAGAVVMQSRVNLPAEQQVVGFHLPQRHVDDFVLYDEPSRTARVVYEIQDAQHTQALIRVADEVVADGAKLYVADGSTVVEVQASASAVTTRAVVDFGGGKRIERLKLLNGEFLAFVRDPSDSALSLQRFTATANAPQLVVDLGAGTFRVTDSSADVVLVTFTPDGSSSSKALAYDGASHTVTTYQDSLWIGATSITDAGTDSTTSAVLRKVSDADFKLQVFGEDFLLVTQLPATSQSKVRMVKREALGAPIELATLDHVTAGDAENLGPHVLVELRLVRPPSNDRDVYLWNVGPTPGLVPVAAHAGLDEFLTFGQIE